MEPSLFYRIDGDRRQVHVTYRRQPDFLEWEKTMKGVLQDPDYCLGYDILLDRSQLRTSASADYIQRLVAFVDNQVRQTRTGRWAIVVADLASYGMGRMAEQLSETNSIRTFRELEEAGDWLSSCPVA